MDLGPNAVYVWASYGAGTVLLASMVGWLFFDGARQKQRLDRLEARGITRRSTVASKSSQSDAAT
jgi:heme exporter protein CcmD